MCALDTPEKMTMRWNTTWMTATALLALGCAEEGDNTDETELASLTDDEIASQVWTEIADYETWDRFEGQSATPVEGSGHMGMFVLSYYSPEMVDWDLDGDAPDGSVSVKEMYMSADAATPVALTVMRKVDGYAPQGGDWFWVDFGVDGTVNAAGALEMCVSCHSGASTDYVFAE